MPSFDRTTTTLTTETLIPIQGGDSFSDTRDNGDLIDYYALSIALNDKDLLRYSRDHLPLESTGCLNFLSHPAIRCPLNQRGHKKQTIYI